MQDGPNHPFDAKNKPAWLHFLTSNKIMCNNFWGFLFYFRSCLTDCSGDQTALDTICYGFLKTRLAGDAATSSSNLTKLILRFLDRSNSHRLLVNSSRRHHSPPTVDTLSDEGEVFFVHIKLRIIDHHQGKS